jgi:regulator of sigma E protease
MMSILSDFGGLIYTIVSFLLALAVIVAVHEYGHYIVGRWSGIKAEVFSLGFGPVLASSRPDRFGTRWQIAAIPLGGFVRFKGDQDAASALPAGGVMSPTEARQTLAGAPIWARMLTVAAGPVFNFVLAFFIFVGLILSSGLAADRPIIGALYSMPTAQGLMQGDEITAIEGQPTPDLATFFQVADAVPPLAEVGYTVLRAGQTVQVTAPHPLPARAALVHLQSAAFEAGLREGDVITQVNGQPIYAFSQLPPFIEASMGAPLDVQVWRPDGSVLNVLLEPNRRDLPTADGGFETRWMIGLSSGPIFDLQRRSAGLGEAMMLSFSQMGAVFEGTFSGLLHMIRGDISTCNLSGPVGLADTMGQAARSGVESFVTMLAMVSLGVGILNLLPVPVLDGGHLVFFAVEAITRRKPNPRFVNMAVMVGLFLVTALTIFALGNDLTCS